MANEYIPKIYNDKNIDEIIYISQDDAEKTTRDLTAKEGIFSGPSSGGTTFVALEIAKERRMQLLYLLYVIEVIDIFQQEFLINEYFSF